MSVLLSYTVNVYKINVVCCIGSVEIQISMWGWGRGSIIPHAILIEMENWDIPHSTLPRTHAPK